MQFSKLYDQFKSIGNKYNLKISPKGDFVYELLKQPDIDSRTAERYYNNNSIRNKNVIRHFINNTVIDFDAFIKSIFRIQNVPAELMESCKTELRFIYSEISRLPAKNISERILLERCVHHIIWGNIYNSYFICPLKKVPVFYGRSNEIETIHTLFNDNNIIFIKGTAGIGKTQCILEYTRRFHTEYRNIAFGQSTDSVQDALCAISFNQSCSDYFSTNNNRMVSTHLLNLLRFFPYNNLIILECDSITSKDQVIIDTLAEMEVKIIIAARHISIFAAHPVITISELDSALLQKMLNKIYSEGESQIKKAPKRVYEPLTDEDKEKIIGICYHHTLLVSLTAHLLHLKPEIKRNLLNITSIRDFKGYGRISHIYDNDQNAITSHISNMLYLACIPDCDLNYLALLSLFTPVPIRFDTLAKWGFDRNFNTLKSYGVIEFSQLSDNNTYLYMHPLISDALWSTAQLPEQSIDDKINNFITYLNWGNEKITDYTTLYAIIDIIVKRITPNIKSFHNPKQKKASKNIQHWWHVLEKLLIFELESGATAKVNAILDRIFKVDEHQRTTKCTRPYTHYNRLINDRQQLFLDICQFYTLWLNGQLSVKKTLDNLLNKHINSPIDSDYDLH